MITQHHQDIYARDGVVKIEGAFTADWVECLTSGFDDLMTALKQKEAPRKDDLNLLPMDADWHADLGKEHLRNGAPHYPPLWAWVTESPAAEIVGHVIGADSVQFWYDLWFCKYPGGTDTATPWHHDIPGHCFQGSHVPALWIALTEIGPDDAPLLTIPGSHKDDRMFPPPYVPGREHLGTPPGFTDVSVLHSAVETAKAEERIQAWTMAPGDALVLHPATWHGSAPAAPDRPSRRLACTSRWLGTDCAYKPGPFTTDGYYSQTSNLAAETHPPVDFLPIVWQRQEGA